MHLLHQRRIPRKSLGIEIAHLVDQRLYLLPRFGTFLYGAANLVEKVQSLFDLALCIGRVRTLLGRYRLSHDVRVARVQVVEHLASALSSRADHPVPHRTALAPAIRAAAN